ncbi:MAG: hypothetical protein HKN23_17945 [Verrucomicrobiales bacterium]|nr:hypothetical protein [Verrucomicrobiales bacterium]
MIFDTISVYFENPATDALGYEHVEGKLYCGRDAAELHFKEKDRAFRKTDPITVEFDYSEIEKVEFQSGWFRPKILSVCTRCPEKLKDFPGADVGKVELQVSRKSVSDARKVAAFIEYKHSEVYLMDSNSRLEEKRGDLESGI